MPQPSPSIQVEILEPRDRAQVPANHVVYLRASASTDSGEIGDRIRWRSSRDGFLGQGAEIQVQLSEGKHRIRAGVRRRSRRQPDRAAKARSQTGGESQGDSEDDATDTVTVHSVPVDYPGGDT